MYKSHKEKLLDREEERESIIICEIFVMISIRTPCQHEHTIPGNKKNKK